MLSNRAAMRVSIGICACGTMQKASCCMVENSVVEMGRPPQIYSGGVPSRCKSLASNPGPMISLRQCPNASTPILIVARLVNLLVGSRPITARRSASIFCVHKSASLTTKLLPRSQEPALHKKAVAAANIVGCLMRCIRAEHHAAASGTESESHKRSFNIDDSGTGYDQGRVERFDAQPTQQAHRAPLRVVAMLRLCN